MTSKDAVEKVKEKIEKIGTNDNLSFDASRIIPALIEAQNKFTEWILEKKNEDDIRLIEHLLINQNLKKSDRTEMLQSFNLPKDFFDHSNLFTIAEQDGCKDKILTWEIKNQNANELYFDTNNEPSFYYRETFYQISNKKVNIYIKNFEIDEAKLFYYRYPTEIDVEGYTKIDGSQSKNVDPEWGDRAMDRIISIAVKDLNLNSENFPKYQTDRERITNKF